MIRNIDVETWAMLRAEAVRRRLDTAAMVEQIVREWRATERSSLSRTPRAV